MSKWIYRILLVICLGVFGYSAFMLWSLRNEQNESDNANGNDVIAEIQKENEADGIKGFNPDWDKLREKFPDIVGWIYIPDCPTAANNPCSFAVVRGSDNAFYLDHAANQEYSRYGAVFMDFQASPTFEQDNTVLYGHSSDDGAMMTQLSNFADKKFFDEHPYFYYFSPQGNYKCATFIFAKVEDGCPYYEPLLDNPEYSDEEGYSKDEILQFWYNNALYRNDLDIEGKKFMTISTCNVKEYGFFSDQRLILMGILEPTEEPIEIKH